MQKPENYDQTEAKQFSANERPPAGAYVMRIVNAKEEISSNNRPMLVLALDITHGPFTNNFKKLNDYLKGLNPESKWPCVNRRCTDGNQIEYFKGDIKAIEESNEGFKFNFDEKTLIGKTVGCMLGEKEINEDGKTILEPRYLCSVKKAISGELKPIAIKKFVAQTRQPGCDDDTPPLPW
jgi:hypothetical protein